MNSIFIALPLTKSIKDQIQRLCYGIPSVQWIDHSHFHLSLFHFGPLDGAFQLDIQDELAKIRFSPFEIFIQGVDYSPSKKKNGTIWATIAPSKELTNFKKLIDNKLKTIFPKINSQVFVPHITLGHFQTIDQRRLADYLETNSFFTTTPLIIDAFVLMKSQKTSSETTIYKELKRFPLITPINKLRILND